MSLYVCIHFLDRSHNYYFVIMFTPQYTALYLSNEIHQDGDYWGRLVVGDQGGVLGKATPCGFGCHTCSRDLVTHARTFYLYT